MADHPPAERRITCRYLNRHGDQCTGEAVDAQGEILLCVRHLGLALELVRARTEAAQ